MFTIGGMKFYGNPEVSNMVWSYPADGSDDGIIPESYFLLDEAGYDAVRAIQALEYAPTPAEVLASALSKRDSLLTVAALRVAPLQDAVDLDDATADDIEMLKKWKQYRVAVSKTETKPGWPDSPQWPEPPVPLETSV